MRGQGICSTDARAHCHCAGPNGCDCQAGGRRHGSGHGDLPVTRRSAMLGQKAPADQVSLMRLRRVLDLVFGEIPLLEFHLELLDSRGVLYATHAAGSWENDLPEMFFGVVRHVIRTQCDGPSPDPDVEGWLAAGRPEDQRLAGAWDLLNLGRYGARTLPATPRTGRPGSGHLRARRGAASVATPSDVRELVRPRRAVRRRQQHHPAPAHRLIDPPGLGRARTDRKMTDAELQHGGNTWLTHPHGTTEQPARGCGRRSAIAGSDHSTRPYRTATAKRPAGGSDRPATAGPRASGRCRCTVGPASATS